MAKEKNRDKESRVSLLIKEFKKIHWPKWKEDKTNKDPGILNTFVKVVAFTAVFVAFFVVCDLALAGAFRGVGI